MKKVLISAIAAALTLALCMSATSCGNVSAKTNNSGIAEDATVAENENETAFAESDKVKYTNEGYDEIIFDRNDDGSYSADVGLFRLAGFDCSVVKENDRYVLTPHVGDEYHVMLHFYAADDGSYTLETVESDWKVLETGCTFDGFYAVME